MKKALRIIVPLVLVVAVLASTAWYFLIYDRQLTKDIIPYIEKNYRVKTDSANRALAGLSMGGLETLESFMAHPDLFGYINVMSSGWFTNDKAMYENGEKRLNEIAATLNKTAKLLRFTQGGPADIAYENGKAMLKVFGKCGIKSADKGIFYK